MKVVKNEMIFDNELNMDYFPQVPSQKTINSQDENYKGDKIKYKGTRLSVRSHNSKSAVNCVKISRTNSKLKY